ncbi:MAG: deoxyguanosinetriphosphate triphosphohydrolase [Proteobacteria bacterium]|nr:deoxyguanosinetriphosphate triphosphohydrolase [Pseudomonadota bacterium]
MRAAPAAYAADPATGRGRRHAEPMSRTRSEFRRDCDRIIHASAFRRLAYKTQVFVFDEGDHYRTRLTHTLEVTQIARSLARALGLDEDLAEASALAHDLGHPPFGHAGERALDESLAAFGGFDHNAQTLAVVTRLERRYAAFDGLNLTWETLEGLVKHNGPLTDGAGRPCGRHAARGVPDEIAAYIRRHDLRIGTHASAEAQVAAIADDIAYNAHDIDDGLRAGLFALGDIAAIAPIGEILDAIAVQHQGLDPARRAHELIRGLIGRMIEDVVAQTRARLAALAPISSDAIRAAPHGMVAFSQAFAAADRAIKDFLFARMYRHARVMRVMEEARALVCDLFARYRADAQALPAEWRVGVAGAHEHGRARRIADFIAGMTDRYALDEHRRLFDSTPDLR